VFHATQKKELPRSVEVCRPVSLIPPWQVVAIIWSEHFIPILSTPILVTSLYYMSGLSRDFTRHPQAPEQATSPFLRLYWGLPIRFFGPSLSLHRLKPPEHTEKKPPLAKLPMQISRPSCMVSWTAFELSSPLLSTLDISYFEVSVVLVGFFFKHSQFERP